jgi:ligand-binding sensor domain-containing protein
LSFTILVIAIFVFPFNSLKSETGNFINYNNYWESFLNIANWGDYVLLGTIYDGVYSFNKKTGSIDKLPGSDSLTKYGNSDLKVDKNNKVWGLSFYSGLFEYDGENFINYNIYDTELKYYRLTCLIIDEQDNKWVGSVDKGLFKFDGTQWEIFNKSNSDIPTDEIRRLTIDANGNIWIGTDIGLLMFDGTNFIHYNTENSGLVSNKIRTIASDSENQLWIGTDKGLLKYDGNNWLTFENENIPVLVNYIHSIHIDKNNKIYIGSEIGIGVYDKTNWIEYNRSNSGLSDNSVLKILTDDFDNVWISTSIDGLIKFDGTTWSNFKILKQDYGFSRDAQIVEDKNGIIWVKASWAVFSFDGTYWKMYGHSNSELPLNGLDYHSETLSSIAVDSNNNIWVGSSKYGLSKFDGTKWINYNKSNSELKEDEIRSLYVTKDNILIVNAKSSTMTFDGTSWQSTDMLANKLAFDNSGLIWNIFSHPNVLFYYEYIDGIAVPVSFLPPDHLNSDLYLTDLVIDSKDNKWIASTLGLLKFDGTNWTTYDFSNLGLDLQYSFVQAIAIDKNDVLWMVVEFGYLLRFDGVNWTVFEPFIPMMFEPNYVTSLTVDINGNLWIGTSWTGVYVFNEDEIILNPADVIETFIQNDYKIFPNPVDDIININGLENDNFEYQIFDLSMKQVVHSFGKSNQLNVSNLNTGIYYLVIKEKTKLQVMKFIKQ